MGKHYANFHGAIAGVLGLLTLLLIWHEFSTTDLAFFDSVSLCWTAFIALFALGFIYHVETNVGVPSEFFRMSFTWPFALALIWNSFFNLLAIWGASPTDAHGFEAMYASDPGMFGDLAWYAHSWVRWVGSFAILMFGFLAPSMYRSE